MKREQTASDGTRKFLFVLEDCLAAETVLMMQDYGMSVCVSSQVGCSMGCSFCASGLQAKVRDLTGRRTGQPDRDGRTPRRHQRHPHRRDGDRRTVRRLPAT
ncbi:MAG: hypothetical protein MZU97_09635 [Bacillus subtilis]|nr:hypothetical protein [Bacillus subtilis]